MVAVLILTSSSFHQIKQSKEINTEIEAHREKQLYDTHLPSILVLVTAPS
jgi:hypothetical protein